MVSPSQLHVAPDGWGVLSHTGRRVLPPAVGAGNGGSWGFPYGGTEGVQESTSLALPDQGGPELKLPVPSPYMCVSNLKQVTSPLHPPLWNKGNAYLPQSFSKSERR